MPRTQCLDKEELRKLGEEVRVHGLTTPLVITDETQSPASQRSAAVVYKGAISIEGQQATIHVGLTESFPLSLPLIYILPPEALGFIPHVDAKGYICYASSEGMLLVRHNPLAILEESLERAIDVLTKGVRGTNRLDFVDEFDAYWCQLDGVRPVDSFVSPTDEVREIDVARKGGCEAPFEYIADNQAVVDMFFNRVPREQWTVLTAVYIPLRPGTVLIPPAPGTFWSTGELRDWTWANLSEHNQIALKRLIKKFKREETLIFKLPRPNGGEALFGVRCLGVESAHPLARGGRVQQFIPLRLGRRDKEYLLPRSGAHVSLATKRVALVGCGSVGGFIALELARLGVLNLTLIDHDKLTVDNTFRHALGKDGCGNNKAKALKAELEEKFPYLKAIAVPHSIEFALKSDLIQPHQFDLIVVAVGEASLNLYLNQYFHHQHPVPPVIFTWLEAYGIGGHALLTLNESGIGCLECVYTPPAGDIADVYDRSSFAAAGQTFTKDLSGCASLFTPFGSLAALRTAVLAVELAGDVLLGRVHGNPLLSWKGTSSDFHKAGYTSSARYAMTSELLWEGRFLYQNYRCQVCGQKDI